MKFKLWSKRIGVYLLIALAIWLGRSEKYTYTPETTFTTITGYKISMQALRGKTVLINFWATSCPSCLNEIPHLIALYDKFHPRGLEIIAVAMVYDPPNRVVEFAKSQNLPYRVVLDIHSEFANSFGHIWATPTTVLIGSDGEVKKSFVGMFGLPDMASRIEHLLKG